MHPQLLLRLALLLVFLTAFPALTEAQIKQPGAHARYSVELEPHVLSMWNRGPLGYRGDGYGIGGRVSIPLFHNGPIDRINNNMAIGFGLDYVHFGYDDDRWCRVNDPAWCGRRWNIDADVFWLPVALQWNFFVHRRVSVFGEVGFAIQHISADRVRPCGPMDPESYCVEHYRDTDFFEPLFSPGARFHLTDTITLTGRIGFPHLTLGASFLF